MIRTLCVVMMVAMTLVTSVSARADGLEWTGLEVLTKASGELEVTEHVGARGEADGFFVPSKKFVMGFFYLGPTFSPPSTKNFSIWVSPQVVFPLGKFDETDAIGPSLWINMKFLEGKFSLFLLGDVYFPFDGGRASYFGAYSLDGHPAEWFNFGWHVEQVDLHALTGPHVGTTFGPAHFEVQWYVGMEEDQAVTTLRLVMGLDFFANLKPAH
ncbi:hypothetical protein HQ524_00050 [Candidatus Uhrbacteria bacterium]|nr:hypothetical protein [Candidatus Uhrbacteria bacterium]